MKARVSAALRRWLNSRRKGYRIVGNGRVEVDVNELVKSPEFRAEVAAAARIVQSRNR